MFEKITGIMKVKEEIDKINVNIQENNKVISELKAELIYLKNTGGRKNRAKKEKWSRCRTF